MIRITGGTMRGRKLRVPPGDATRPTSDMVRQALFNLLGQSLDDALVLDVFCGSGALGLEALSRGAARAWLVDKSRKVCDVVKANVAELGVAERATLVCSDATAALLRLPSGAASLALCDPPYALQDRAGLMTALAHAVREGGTLVFETAERDALSGAGALWERLDDRSYGGTRLHILRRTGTPAL